MKTLKTALVVIMTACALLATMVAGSSAPAIVSAEPDQPKSGNLYQKVPPNPDTFPTYEAGQVLKVEANFNGGARGVTLYKETATAPDSNVWEPHLTDEADSYGNAFFSYTVTEGPQRIYAEDEDGLETEVDTLTGTPAPPSSGLLDTPAPGASGKTFTAHFTPKVSGKATKLEVQTIYTKETNETDAVDPNASPKVGPWETIATSTQNSNGDTTFTKSDPLEVKHKYRAVSGSTISNVVEFAAPLPTSNPYGISTGLSQVHFNTYEGDSVNTRTRNFEGEFSMTASSKLPACQAVAPMKNSVMKGRGNYSWSFPKKGFTLKIDKKTDLCGMGVGKKYALIANDYDKSLLRNSLAQFVGSKFTNMAWTPKSSPVDLFVNGSYRGSYILVERIAIQGPKTDATYSPRVDIDELKAEGQTTNTPPGDANNSGTNLTGGYLMEWDFRKGADNNPYLGSDSGYVGLKDPENDVDREGNRTTKGISTQQKSYITEYLNDADSALRGSNFKSDTSGWKKYIDEDSAIDYYLAMEYMKPVDGNMWASVYMYKPRGGKLEFGPMWDFDLAAGSANRAGNVASTSSWYLRNSLGVSAMQSSKTWFNRLNEDEEFRAAAAARWNEITASGLNVSEFIDGQEDILAESAAANFKKWGSTSRISKYQAIKGSWTKDVSFLRSWAVNRKSWVSGQF